MELTFFAPKKPISHLTRRIIENNSFDIRRNGAVERFQIKFRSTQKIHPQFENIIFVYGKKTKIKIFRGELFDKSRFFGRLITKNILYIFFRRIKWFIRVGP